MTFRDRLREELEAQHISKKELASRLGISYSTMLSYIDARGIMPSADMAVRIAEILGVSVEYLVTGKNSDLPQDFAYDSFVQYRHLINSLQELPPAVRQQVITSMISLLQLVRTQPSSEQQLSLL